MTLNKKITLRDSWGTTFNSPADLAGLVSWLNPDSSPQSTFIDNPPTTLCTNAQGFLSYKDQVGSSVYYHNPSNSFIQGWSDAAHGLNGHATTFVFGASTVPNQRDITLTSSTKLAVFSVIQPTITTGSANYNRFFSMISNGATGDHNNVNSFNIHQVAGTLNLGINANNVESGGAYAMTLNTWFKFAAVISGGVASLYAGPSLAFVESISVAFNFVTPLSFGIGANITDGGTPQAGTYGDIVVVSGDVSPTDISNMSTWMNSKWGV